MKRYSTHYPDMFEDEDGEWVKWEDVAEIIRFYRFVKWVADETGEDIADGVVL